MSAENGITMYYPYTVFTWRTSCSYLLKSVIYNSVKVNIIVNKLSLLVINLNTS